MNSRKLRGAFDADSSSSQMLPVVLLNNGDCMRYCVFSAVIGALIFSSSAWSEAPRYIGIAIEIEMLHSKNASEVDTTPIVRISGGQSFDDLDECKNQTKILMYPFAELVKGTSTPQAREIMRFFKNDHDLTLKRYQQVDPSIYKMTTTKKGACMKRGYDQDYVVESEF